MKLIYPHCKTSFVIALAIAVVAVWSHPNRAVGQATDPPTVSTEDSRNNETESDKIGSGKSKSDETGSDETSSDESDPLGLQKMPSEGEGIGVDEKLGNVINGRIKFHDSENRLVNFGDFFDGQRPVMLSFNYSDCPKLCSVQLTNMTQSLREIDFEVGKDFDVVSISIDPNEQTSRARETKDKYAGMYNRAGSEIGWHFLTGDRADIKAVADQCGFRYKYIAEQKLYSHPPVFILISPEGKIVRYIHGLDYDPDTMRQALIEAAEGKIGSAINYLSYGIGCFSYNDSTGKYTFQAMAVMRIGGLITVLGLLVTLVPYWFFRRNSDSAETHGGGPKFGLAKPVGETGSH